MLVSEFRGNKNLLKEFVKFRNSELGNAVVSVIESECLRPSLPAKSSDCNNTTCAISIGEYAGSWKVFDILNEMMIVLIPEAVVDEEYPIEKQGDK